MNCHEAERLLNPYVDGELDLVTVVNVEEHIAGCAGCSRAYHELQELQRIITESDLEFLPTPGLERRVRAARRSVEAASQPWWRRAAPLAAAAAVLLLLFIPV